VGADRQQPDKLWCRDFVLAIATNLFLAMVYYLLMTSMAKHHRIQR
jgi:hypothetical protein